MSALYTKKPYTLHALATIATTIWKFDAFDILLKRLEENICAGCEHIYKVLVELAPNNRRSEVIKKLLFGLLTKNIQVASGAAKLIQNSDWEFSKQDKNECNKALKYWTDIGSYCNRCNQVVMGSCCCQCHIVPDSPRAPLIGALAKMQILTSSDLFKLITDDRNDVAEVSCESLAWLAIKNRQLMRSILEKIRTGDLATALLDSILSLPNEVLNKYHTHLSALIQSPYPDVRIRLIASLKNEWLTSKEIKIVLQKALKDKKPRIRDQAVRTIRLREQ